MSLDIPICLASLRFKKAKLKPVLQLQRILGKISGYDDKSLYNS